MNASLLARLVEELRPLMVGYTLGPVAWFPPVLSISYDRSRHLVAVLEAPGPFCFVARSSPFEGAHAPVRFAHLAGAEVRDVSLEHGDRILRIDALPRDDGEPVSLLIRLYGSAGGAELRRGDAVLETVGRIAVSTRTGSAPASPAVPPFTIALGARAGAATPIARGAALPEDTRALGPYNLALDACADVGARVLDGAHESIIHRVTRPARRKIEALRKLTVKLDGDLAKAGEHIHIRREAETLATYQTQVRARAARIELPDPYEPERTLEIELDPALPIHVQIEKRFKRASKLEKSTAHAQRRLALATREVSELETSLRFLEQAGSFAEALRIIEAMRAKFGIDFGATPDRARTSKAREPEKTYRQFDLDARWFAIVGRSNFENDEITFRVAGPQDYWFHAQGVPGSHVVLKSRGGGDAPSARIIETTAKIAAHFSKARHSSLVPVIYTQRKYVRKFRGAQAGQVTCERETMVMVPPEVPPDPTPA